jgi:pyruvate/2-oxoglutarate dehydrogenase complex dihydrolipoamide dehydrogenase (E3) component
VTVVQRGQQLLPREDPDVSEAIQTLFREDGIEIVVGAETRAVGGRSGDRVRLELRTAEGERTIDGSDLLVATGRTPNTLGIGLDTAGIELDARGFVKVDERLRTTAPGVWAMGECAGSPQFTHVSFDDFRVVRDDLAGKPRTTKDRLIPYCVFTDPTAPCRLSHRRHQRNPENARLLRTASDRVRCRGDSNPTSQRSL